MGNCLSAERSEEETAIHLEEREPKCLICLNKPVDTFIFNCGHEVICYECGRLLQEQNSNRNQPEFLPFYIHHIICPTCVKPCYIFKTFSQSSNVKKCWVCQGPADALTVPCGHDAICFNCCLDFVIKEGDLLIPSKDKKVLICPMCRKEGLLILDWRKLKYKE